MSGARRIPLIVLLATVLAMGLVVPAVAGPPPDDGTNAPVSDVDAVAERDPAEAQQSHDAVANAAAPSSSRAASALRNLQLTGRGERLEPDATTDVWTLGRYSYIGTFNNPCGDGTGANGSGIPIFDVHNKSKPVEVGRVPSVLGSRINDVKAADLTTGTILVHSNESCDGGPGGFEVYDATDGANPTPLFSVRIDDVNNTLASLGITDVGVHNLFLFTQGGRDYVAVVAETVVGNFQIFDITDVDSGVAPTRVGFWGAEQLAVSGVDWVNEDDEDFLLNGVLPYLASDGFGISRNRFLHDITISDDGLTAYLANWDAGLVRMDISDVTNPTPISVALDPVNGSLDGEVNSHSMWPNADGSVVVEGEEDFSAITADIPLGNGTFGESPNNTIPGVGVSRSAGDVFTANPTGNSGSVDADSVDVTSGPLAGQSFPAVEFSGDQPRFATTGPVSGALVFVGRACNTDPLENPLAAGDIAVVRRGACTFAEKLANVAAAGAAAIVIANNAPDTPWGGIRIWDYADPANPVLASVFNTVCSANPLDPSCDPRGTYTVHNVIVEGTLAYLSWYSDGVVVLDISDPYNPVEIARYNPTGPAFEAQNGGIQDVWGIYKVPHRPAIYASDRNGGLYILQLGGRNPGRP